MEISTNQMAFIANDEVAVGLTIAQGKLADATRMRVGRNNTLRFLMVLARWIPVIVARMEIKSCHSGCVKITRDNLGFWF